MTLTATSNGQANSSKSASKIRFKSDAEISSMSGDPCVLTFYRMLGGDKKACIAIFYGNMELQISNGKFPFEFSKISSTLATVPPWPEEERTRYLQLEKFYLELHHFIQTHKVLKSDLQIKDWSVIGVQSFFDAHYNPTVNPYDQVAVLSQVGSGVFANVYKVNIRGTVFAIKIATSKKSNSFEPRKLRLKDRFAAAKEALILKHLDSENTIEEKSVIKLKKFFMLGGHPCFVFPFWPQTLSGYVKKRLSLEQIQKVGKRLGIGLRHLKIKGVIHADLHSHNIFVHEEKVPSIEFIPNPPKITKVAIADFGVSQLHHPLQEGEQVLAKALQPPELLLSIPYGVSIDSWTLGVMLFYMYTGFYLFSNKGREQISDRVLRLGMPSFEFIEVLPKSIANKHFGKMSVTRKIASALGEQRGFYGSEMYYCKALGKDLQRSAMREDFNLGLDSATIQFSYASRNVMEAKRIRFYRLYHFMALLRSIPEGGYENFKNLVYVIAGLLTWEVSLNGKSLRETPEGVLKSTFFGQNNRSKPSTTMAAAGFGKPIRPNMLKSGTLASGSANNGLLHALQYSNKSPATDFFMVKHPKPNSKQVVSDFSGMKPVKKITDLIEEARKKLEPKMQITANELLLKFLGTSTKNGWANLLGTLAMQVNITGDIQKNRHFIWNAVVSIYEGKPWNRYGYEPYLSKLRLIHDFLSNKTICLALGRHLTKALDAIRVIGPSSNSAKLRNELLRQIDVVLKNINSDIETLSTIFPESIKN